MKMLKIRILKENKILVEGKEGLYTHIGVKPGSLDLFLDVFTGSDPSFDSSLRNFISKNYQTLIDGLGEADIPPETSARGYESPLAKVRALLSAGVVYWWYELFGLDIARKIIRFQVIAYYIELEDKLEDIGYGEEDYDFNSLSDKDKNTVYEKHFWEDYLDSFFDKHVSKAADIGNKWVGGENIPTGLYGQLKDWWMSTDGRGIFKAEMRDAKNELYKTFRKEKDLEDPPEGKEPQWFEKGVDAWDDGAVGYDREEDVPGYKDRMKDQLDT